MASPHRNQKVIEKDEKKQKDLEEVGFTVLRFDDEEVLNDIENVERVLLGFIEDFERSTPLAAREPSRSPASGGKNKKITTKQNNLA